MSVNRTCLIKSLKKDYTNYGIIIGVVATVFVVVFVIFLAQDTLRNIFSFITAFNTYIATEIIIAMVFMYIVATDTMTSCYEKNLGGYLIIPTIFMIIGEWIFYVLYLATSSTVMTIYHAPAFPDVTIITIAIGIASALLMPVSVAISRCRCRDI